MVQYVPSVVSSLSACRFPDYRLPLWLLTDALNLGVVSRHVDGSVQLFTRDLLSVNKPV